MFLRPGSLIKNFVVEPVSRTVDTKGRPQVKYATENCNVLRGVLSDADANVITRYGQTEHPCTHQIVQRGNPLAKPGDRLVHDRSYYYILGVDHIAQLGIVTIYHVEKRADLDDGSKF